MTASTAEATAEVVADCSYRGGGLPAAALSGAAAELYAPLVVGTEPGGPRESDRREVAEILAAANRDWGHPRADELAAMLADPSARVVVTGQQPGILGGPLYSLVKALTAGLWAERLRAEGTVAVAVFWVAGEDHDFREVASTAWLAASDLETASLGEDAEPLVPVGGRRLGPGIEELLAGWRETLPSDFWQAEADRLAAHYRPEATFTDAFAAYTIAMLGERAPLLLDAQDAGVKRFERPWLEKLIEEREQVTSRRAEHHSRIEEAGFDLQVTPREGAAPLFLHEKGRRRRILWQGDGFVLDSDGEPRPVDELVSALTADPTSVSPSAVARPPTQDALLGTSLFVVGPGELAYLAQSAPLYELLGVEAPALVMRPSVALAARRKAEQVGELGVPLVELAGDGWDAERFLAERHGDNPVAGTAARIGERMAELRRELQQLDPNLDQPWRKTERNIAQALDRLGSKVDASLARSDEVAAARVGELQSLLRPGGAAQERALSTAWALGRFGADLPDKLVDVLDLTPGRMQVVAV